jgi:hypothetical protein
MNEPKTHGEMVAAGLRDELDFRGLMSESHCCVDCGYNTNPGTPTREEAEKEVARQIAAGIKNWGYTTSYDNRSEIYMVHPHVWERAGMEGYGGCLCITCLEKRIGRVLRPDDFAEHPFNSPKLPGTRRRLERLLGEELFVVPERPEGPSPSRLDLAYQAALGKQWRAA